MFDLFTTFQHLLSTSLRHTLTRTQKYKLRPNVYRLAWSVHVTYSSEYWRKFRALLLIKFSSPYRVAHKNDALHIQHMPRHNFLLAPCLAWKLELIEAPFSISCSVIYPL
jgi:hypothetical protein